MSVGYIVLAIYIIAIMNMHYRGVVRFPWLRQALTHTNYLAPYNLLMNLCSKHQPTYNYLKYEFQGRAQYVATLERLLLLSRIHPH